MCAMMGPKASSGFYLSRTSALLLAVLLAALLLALIVLAALYGRTMGSERGGQSDPEDSIISNITESPFSFTLPTKTPGPPGIWDHPRLPPHLYPVHYDLELWPRMEPDGEGKYLMSGQVTITVRCVSDTDTILLHCYKLNVTRVLITSIEETGGDINVTRIWYSSRHQYLVLHLDTALLQGRNYSLYLDYTGTLSDDYSGLFISHYKDLEQERVLVGSELEPASARTVYPCFDEPALKATFKTTIVHNSSYVALSNMPAIAMYEREDENGTKWTVTTFNTTLKMSTYITAFVVCDFDYVNMTERGSEIRVWARKEVVQKGYANFALAIAGPMLSFMEDFLNVPYPLQKTDFVAMPQLSVGAMENWGLITFEESSLMYNPDKKFTTSRALTSLIVAHEIGHQWFGNLVTMKWWNDIWLNEGFASYMEYAGASLADPKLRLNEFFMVHNLINIFDRDTRSTARAVSVKEDDIGHVDDIVLLFDEFTYDKASALLRMASTFLTEKLFIKGISSYLKKFSFSNADQDDLWNHMQMFIDDQDEVHLPTSLKKIMDSWTWKRGIPLVTVNTSTGTLTQDQFKTANADNTTSDNNHTWIIPIYWMKNGVQQPTVWLDTKTKTVPEMTTMDNEWIILNINVTGYYRINYDEKNWNNLAKTLEEKPQVLSVVNRMQLIDDVFTLTNSGYLEYETALSLTRYLEQEMEVIVWYIVLKHMNSYKKSLVTYHSFPHLKKYILKRIKPIFQHYASVLQRNFDETADDFFVHTGIDLIFKTACSFGMPDCLSLASDIYTKWMANISNNEIPQSIKGTVYCYGIAVGGEKEWDHAWSVYNKSDLTDVWDYSYLKHSLSCTKEPWLLYRYLDNVMLDGAHSLMDTFTDMFKNDIGRHIAWEFLKENWHRLKDEASADETELLFERLVTDLGWKATSELQFQEMQLFITTAMDESLRESEVQRLEKRKKARLEWVNIVNTKIIDWLQKNTLDSDL